VKSIFIICTLCCLASTTVGHAQSPSTQSHVLMPADISLGMEQNEFQKVRQDARQYEVSVGLLNTNAIVFTEIERSGKNTAFYHYHILEGRLRAVTQGYGRNRDPQVLINIRNQLQQNYSKRSDDNILRLDNEMNRIPTTAELWESSDNLNVYIVETTNELTVITFDPQHFSKNDFFMNPDNMPRIAPMIDAASKTLEELKSPAINGK